MSSPIVFSLTAPQRDALATLALFPAAWPNIRRPVRIALHRMGLASAVVRPALTVAGWAAAQLAQAMIANRASLSPEQRTENPLSPYSPENYVGLAHVVAKASPVSGADSSP